MPPAVEPIPDVPPALAIVEADAEVLPPPLPDGPGDGDDPVGLEVVVGGDIVVDQGNAGGLNIVAAADEGDDFPFDVGLLSRVEGASVRTEVYGGRVH